MSQKAFPRERNTLRLTAAKNRLSLIKWIMLLLAAFIAGKLALLQIVGHKTYLEAAEKQQNSGRSSVLQRGNISFRNKNGELVTAATTNSGALIYVNNKLLANADTNAVFEKLNQITPIDKDLFSKIIQKTGDPYEVLKHHISMGEAEKVLSLGIPGIRTTDEEWRFYPAGRMTSQVIGFAPNDPGAKGQYGIEKFYNNMLAGTSADEKISQTGFKGIVSALKDQLQPPPESENLVLTIEPRVEETVENELADLKKQWNAESGGIVIVEPKTGKIIAMAAVPNFDPNHYQEEKNFSVFLNPFVEKIFEMGSVFKPLTISAAIDQGAVTPNTTYIDKGSIKLNGKTISNYDKKARGVMTMTQVLEQSLNTGAVFAMQQIGGDKFSEYLHRFGLGEKLGINLPGEIAGDLTNLNSGKEVEYATASFGQGVAVTPIELTMALSALGNGGKLMRPFVTENQPPQIIREVIKPATSETITSMLVDVVDKALAGGTVKLEHYSIAAKTGTAQVPSADHKGYSDQLLHSFFGYFPAYDPKFLIFMFLNKPQGVEYASQSMTKSFMRLVEFLINYYTIPPDR